MMWSVSGRASAPDGIQGLLRYDGAASRRHQPVALRPAADERHHRKLLALPDGPERDAAFDEAKRLTVAWMPYKLRTHLMQTALWHPRLVGYRRPLFWNQWFDTVDLDPTPEP
jgi:hypothetical protein